MSGRDYDLPDSVTVVTSGHPGTPHPEGDDGYSTPSFPHSPTPSLPDDTDPERKRTNAWIYATLTADDYIRTLGHDLYQAAPSHAYEREPNPHVTIMPQFNIPEDEVHELAQFLASLELSGRSVPMDGIDTYPGDEYPQVVYLDADIDIDDPRSALRQKVEALGGNVFTDPVNPHTTLFSADHAAYPGDWELPERERKQLLATIDDHQDRGRLVTQFDDINLAVD